MLGSPALFAELVESRVAEGQSSGAYQHATREHRNEHSRSSAEMKKYQVSFPDHKDIPAFTVWAHSFTVTATGSIQFWNEGSAGDKMDPVLCMSALPSAKIDEVKDVSDENT